MTANKKDNKQGMRIKDVGATINLGNYSSLHITIGEEQEFAGLDLGRAETYLRNIAKSVDGILNLPERDENPVPKPEPTKVVATQLKDFANDTILYDNRNHKYYNEHHNPYVSVTQLVEEFYPFNAQGTVPQEYMDFAASYGTLMHTAIQNALIGKPPKKTLIASTVKDVLENMDVDGDEVKVEQIIVDHSNELAGRFDILTTDDKDQTTLWDVKTNSDLYAKVDCQLPDQLKKRYDQYWGTETIFGEHCLQLNIYAHILEACYGQKIDKIKIIHVPDGFSAIVEVPKTDITPIISAFNMGR